MARFYAMSIEPTLFGGEALVRNWGRIGTRGRYRVDFFEHEAAAERALARLAGSNAAEAMFQCLTGAGLKSAGKE
jgi:predicted DNA-binding WGR domain protein